MSAITLAMLLNLTALLAGATPAAGWTPMFDGRSLAGWDKTPFKSAGPVTVENGAIRLGNGPMTGITWRREFPKSDYEVRFEAARLEGNDFFASIIFPVNDTHCSWIAGGWGGKVVGLSNLDGDDASENNTTSTRDFFQGRWYAFRLKVTRDRIQGWIDDAQVIDADIAGRNVALRFDDTEMCRPLGFVSYRTTGAIRKVEYRRLDPGSSE